MGADQGTIPWATANSSPPSCPCELHAQATQSELPRALLVCLWAAHEAVWLTQILTNTNEDQIMGWGWGGDWDRAGDVGDA